MVYEGKTQLHLESSILTWIFSQFVDNFNALACHLQGYRGAFFYIC